MTTEYTRVATKEEILSWTEQEVNAFQVKASDTKLNIDPETFAPFIVVEGVRYDIEPIR